MEKQIQTSRVERKKDSVEFYLTIFLYIFFGAGVIWHLWSVTRNLMLTFTPYGLLLANLIVLYPLIVKRYKKSLYWVSITFIFTFIFEIIGIHTGFIFGDYFYGTILGPKLFKVPVLIGLNWVLVIFGSIKISKIFSSDKILSSLIAGLLAVIFDLALEPVAVKFGYWNWMNNSVPPQNYFAWFFITFLASILFYFLRIEDTSKLPKHYFYAQIIFFLMLNFFYR